MKAFDTRDIEERLTSVEQTLETRKPDESIFNPYEDSIFNPDEDEEVADGEGSEP